MSHKGETENKKFQFFSILIYFLLKMKAKPYFKMNTLIPLHSNEEGGTWLIYRNQQLFHEYIRSIRKRGGMDWLVIGVSLAIHEPNKVAFDVWTPDRSINRSNVLFSTTFPGPTENCYVYLFVYRRKNIALLEIPSGRADGKEDVYVFSIQFNTHQ